MKTLIAALALIILSGCSALTVEQQHAIALKNHHYISDQQQYGKDEVWTASLVGDCEDYALAMRERVGGELMYVRTPEGIPHVVLLIDGKHQDKKPVSGMVVDNQSKTVYPLSQMKHKHVYTLTEQHLQNYLTTKPIPTK